MKIKDLKANERNPRTMSAEKKKALKKSIAKFGDLGGFLYNVRTKRLFGGHQKRDGFPNGTVKVEKRYEEPTKAYTVAEGYVEIEGERFKYREVDAPEEWEMEAMVAANRHSGEWDMEILKLNFADFKSLDVEAMGFGKLELKELGIKYTPIELSSPVIVGSDEDADAKYLRENPGPEESINKEAIGGGLPDDEGNAFDGAGKKMDVVSRRYVIIIDCKSEEDKQLLKEKLQNLVTDSGANFF